MSNIYGNGIPTKTTIGVVGDIYIDELTGEKYELIQINTTSKTLFTDKATEQYIWEHIETIDPKYLKEHKHSISDINGIECSEVKETVYTNTLVAKSKRPSLGSTFPFTTVKKNRTIITLNGVPYDCTYEFNASSGVETVRFGEYSIGQAVADSYATIGPLVTGETYEITVETMETSITIPNLNITKAKSIADITEAPTAETFNSLLAALRNAGLMES